MFEVYFIQVQGSVTIHTFCMHGTVIVDNLAPGLVANWNYYRNATLIGAIGPNMTFQNTEVNNWSFELGKNPDDSTLDTTLSTCTIYRLETYENSVTNVYNCTIDELQTRGNSIVNIFDSPSTVRRMFAYDSSVSGLHNSVVDELSSFNSASVYLYSTSIGELQVHDDAALFMYGYSDVSRSFTFEVYGNGIPLEGTTVKLFREDGILLHETSTNSSGLAVMKIIWGYPTSTNSSDYFVLELNKTIGSKVYREIINVFLDSDNYQTILMSVEDSAVLLRNLVNSVEDMNLQRGIENSLDAKLSAVLDAVESLNADQRNDAVNKLYAFMNEVEAQRERKITDEQADYLRAEAQRIVDLIKG